MNFLKEIQIRWPAEEIQKWSSVKKAVYILFPMLIYFAVHDMTEILLWGITELAVSRQNPMVLQFVEANSNTLHGMINGLSILLGVASIWVAVRHEIFVPQTTAPQEKKHSADDVNNQTRVKTAVSYVLLGVLALSASIALNVLFSLIGWTQQSKVFSQIAVKQYGVNFWIGLFLYGIISPFAEEAVFRGLIYNRLKRSFGYLFGIVVSAVLFGFYHGNLIQGVYGFLLGLLIAYTYEKYESFAAPILFHSIANVSIFALTYGNRLSQMSRTTGLIMGGIAFVVAGISLVVIIKRASRAKAPSD